MILSYIDIYHQRQSRKRIYSLDMLITIKEKELNFANPSSEDVPQIFSSSSENPFFTPSSRTPKDRQLIKRAKNEKIIHADTRSLGCFTLSQSRHYCKWRMSWKLLKSIEKYAKVVIKYVFTFFCYMETNIERYVLACPDCNRILYL